MDMISFGFLWWALSSSPLVGPSTVTQTLADPSPLILQWWSLITILTAAHLITLASNISSEVAFYFAVAVVTFLAPCYVDRRRPCYFDHRRPSSTSSISSALSLSSARPGSICRRSSLTPFVVSAPSVASCYLHCPSLMEPPLR
ncbi:hypothetical protein PIB30_048880 [Stylosanthes scabra]|uniref:Uncharacterized protein n=1 Tax=Stylosanthes scabra TaxID=79078 RepID=A0ABU6RHC4_9FABA|nr:hypothetical protein [Stylosanthes scabra]